MEDLPGTPMTDVSIIIPCRDHAKDLERTLEALTKQTVPAKEIVVVDDGSNDDPTVVVKRYEDRLPIRMTRLEQVHGAPFARNTGARLTTAPFLIFLDADVVLTPDALETFSSTLDLHPECDFAYADFRWQGRLFRGQPFDLDALKSRNYISTMSILRRSAFPGFDVSLKKFQDWDLWLTMAMKGSRGVWIDRVLFAASSNRKGISSWLPKVAHRIQWPILGWMPNEVRKYQEAESIIRKKHYL